MMNLSHLPRMMYSYSEGWLEVIGIHPTVARMFTAFVMPMSLIPPAMFIYAQMVEPGRIFPELVPALSTSELVSIAVAFYLAELVMVGLMASLIQQMGDVIEARPSYTDSFMLAAIAPTPLWLSALSLFVPSQWFSGAILIAAWVGCAGLIYHGTKPLFKLEDESKARTMGHFVMMAGVMAWAALLVILALVLSMIVGLR